MVNSIEYSRHRHDPEHHAAHQRRRPGASLHRRGSERCRARPRLDLDRQRSRSAASSSSVACATDSRSARRPLKDQRTKIGQRHSGAEGSPVCGLAVLGTTSELTRTELIVMITPHVIRDDNDAHPSPTSSPQAAADDPGAAGPVTAARTGGGRLCARHRAQAAMILALIAASVLHTARREVRVPATASRGRDARAERRCDQHHHSSHARPAGRTRPPTDATPFVVTFDGRAIRVSVQDEAGRIDLNAAEPELCDGC